MPRLLDNVDARRKARGWSEAELLRRAKLNATFLKDLRRNPHRNPRLDSIEALAAALNCTVSEIMHGVQAAAVGVSEQSSRALFEDYSDPEGDADDGDAPFITLPELAVRAAAGAGADNGVEDVTGVWPFAARALRQLGVSHADAAVIEIVGDSMAPTLLAGDRVLINRADTQLARPGVFILWDGAGLVAKRVERVWGPSGQKARLRLISDNALHAPQEVDAEWVRVVGRVAAVLVRRL